MINKFLNKLCKPMKHPLIWLAVFCILSITIIVCLLKFNIIELNSAKILMALMLTIMPIAFYLFKFCLSLYLEEKLGSIPAIILSLVFIGLVLSLISFAIPFSTNNYSKTINLKNGNAEDYVSFVTEERHDGVRGANYVYNYVHFKSLNNKTYKIKLKNGTKINWKKGKKNKAVLNMEDEYAMFGYTIKSEATKVTVYYVSK